MFKNRIIPLFKKLNNRTIQTISLAIGGVIFIILLFAKSYDKFAIIDLHEAMSKPAIILSQSHYTESEQRKIMQLYSRNLKLVIKAYGQQYKKTIIEARVLSDNGHLDITDVIIALTMEKVKHG